MKRPAVTCRSAVGGGIHTGYLAAPAYRRFKATIFGLLACDAAAFIAFGRPTEAVDSIAWFVLLALFELETAYPQRMRGRRIAALAHFGRSVAAIAVVIAAAGFFVEREWLDAINGVLWIAVVLVLEIEVRYLEAVDRHRGVFASILAILYAGMAGLVAAWAWRGEWFDAYDAALWLVAFVTIEINMLGIAHAGDRPTGEPAC